MKLKHYLLLGLATAGVGACLFTWKVLLEQQQEGEADKPLYQKALRLKRQGKFKAAALAFEKLAWNVPQAPRSHTQAALLYQEELQQPLKAIFHYQLAYPHLPASEKALLKSRIQSAQRDYLMSLKGHLLSGETVILKLKKQVKTLLKENALLKEKLLGKGAHLKTEGHQQPNDNPTARVLASFQAYTVQSGDTWGAISTRFLGKAQNWRIIFEDNRDILDHPNSLKAGQMLKIRLKP